MDGLDLAVHDDGVRFNAVEVECAHADAVDVEELGGFILEAELGGEGGVCEFGFGAAVGSRLVLKPWAGGGVGKLSVVRDERGVNAGKVGETGRGDGELADDGAAGLVFVKAGEVGGELEGQHGKVVDGGVDGLSLGGRGLVEWRVFGDSRGDVGDGYEDADAGWCALGVFDLVEVAGGVVVDGGPEEGGEVFERRVREVGIRVGKG